MQNVTMLVPDYFKYPGVGAADSTFFWCTDNGMAKESHLVIYSIPYTDQNVFTWPLPRQMKDSAWAMSSMRMCSGFGSIGSKWRPVQVVI